MECNKDEAVRAKEIAERKFTERDFAGAKKFALKAQNLYPDLEGLSQMLMTLDVYVSAEKKTITGEVDYYCVLGVSPWADEETVRKQYRKLALMLHPDKNKSLGADGAFKLVSEAWSLLSDKAKRLAYNEKLSVTGSQQRVSTHNSTPATAKGFRHSSSAVNRDVRNLDKNARTGATSVSSYSSKPDTFWTICNRCKTQYEYLRIYLNHTLLCPNCHEAFSAIEKAPPNVMKPSNYSSHQKHHSRHNAANSNLFNAVNSSNRPDQQNHFSGVTGAGGLAQQAHQQVKREHNEAKASAEWKAGHSALGVDQLFKRRRTEETYMNSFGADTGNGRVDLGRASDQRKGYYETERAHGFFGINTKPNSKRELSLVELRNMLMDKAQRDICKKLGEWRSYQIKLREDKKQKSIFKNGASNHKKHDSSVDIEGNRKQSFPGVSSDDSSKDADAPMAINVPDPDFHNFDLDRTESSFLDDQVWAAYDENDGMPRYYARINKVMSLKPFKMRISWLNSKSNIEFSSVDWVGSGFLKTCGDFRAGRPEISGTLNSFSHKVKYIKGTRGVIRILPSKGDVWAVYKNWSPGWNQHTPDEVVHQYDMVEVLDDYNEVQGILVAPLIKVPGFKTVFQRTTIPNDVRQIPKVEMFRFSHQVPYHLLTGEEAPNAPKGCRELDPAATPLELLRVISEVNEAGKVDTALKPEEAAAPSSRKTKVNEMVENACGAKEGGTIESCEQANDDQ